MGIQKYLLGLDIGSSSIKAGLVNADSGVAVASAQSPSQELAINAPNPGWAEQDPDVWWEHVINAIDLLFQSNIDKHDVVAIGISYQMHGLVAVDEQLKVLRPSIIWCDSRATPFGNAAFRDIGESVALEHLLNNPGNFTAAKLAWVSQNEPELYEKIYKIMLPGDYIAARMSGEIHTTISGLSEGIFWDFKNHEISRHIMESMGLDQSHIPNIVPSFGHQAELNENAAKVTGLLPGTPITYRAGDQPNNAVSLNVFEPGELAATAGTSGVIYGINDQLRHDPHSRVNLFAHVNHLPDITRLGVLLCINGTGIQYSWLRNQLLGGGSSYEEMNALAAQAPVGSDGLRAYPFGNGAERVLHNKNLGAQFKNIDFNRHGLNHLLRAANEGIVYALNYGFEAMREMGVQTKVVRAGAANMFLSPLFGEIFSALTETRVELYNTDGALGAARAAGIGSGHFQSVAEAFSALKIQQSIEPNPTLTRQYKEHFEIWKEAIQ